MRISAKALLAAAAACGAAVLASDARAALLPYRNAVLLDNPVAYYELDEAPGATTATDSAALGGAQNGNYIAGLTLGVPSAGPGLGTAVQFGATGPDASPTDDPRIQIPDSPAFDGGTGPFTVEMWLTRTTTSAAAATCSPTRAPAATSAFTGARTPASPTTSPFTTPTETR